MGILAGGYYFHNISLPVIRNSRNPENNVRDVFLGYLLVFFSYTACGILGLYGFTGSSFTGYYSDETIMQSNCLNMFGVKSIVASIIRGCTFMQLISVNCLLFALERA